ncbi:MAG: hypothetical protein FD129_2308 [bacterium]|nr:MAG: hypothetical protein FD129_2308 [bacterium]
MERYDMAPRSHDCGLVWKTGQTPEREPHAPVEGAPGNRKTMTFRVQRENIQVFSACSPAGAEAFHIAAVAMAAWASCWAVISPRAALSFS